jgi:hypothetical protein
MEQSLHHRVRERAYELWNASGRMDGHAEQYWLAAEREVLAEISNQLPALKTVASDPSRRQSRHRTNIGSQRKRTAKAN